MTQPVIASVGTAVPDLYLDQEEVYSLFSGLFQLSSREDALYRRVLLQSRMRGRHVAMHAVEDATRLDQDELIARFTEWGERLSVQAAKQAMERAGVGPGDVDGIIVNTCTGYLCPGLTSYLAEALELSPSCQNLDLMGMGCGGAIPNLHTAGLRATAGGEDSVTLSVAVEICTATMFMGADPGLIISNCIFGDGAAAAVIRNNDAGICRLEDYESGLYPGDREILRYRTEQHRLRNVLHRDVPVVAAGHINDVLGRLLTRQGLSLSDIDHWVVHPGGYEVLDQVGTTLGLSETELRMSYELFTEYGNMSSPSVLFVFERLLATSGVTSGDKAVFLAFGAGFSVYAILATFL